MRISLGTIESKVKVEGLAEFGDDLRKVDSTMQSFADLTTRRFTRVEKDVKAVAKACGMSAQEMQDSLDRAMRQISANTAVSSLERLAKQAGYTKQEVSSLGQQMGLSGKAIQELTDKLYKAKEASSGLFGVKSFGNILQNTFAYGSAYQVLGMIQQIPKAVLDANAQLESLRKSFEGIYGVTEGAAQFQYASTLATKYGKDLDAVADSYRKFAAASEYVGVSSQETKRTFEAVTQAITKVGGSTSDVQGSLTALQQMLSKGTVSSEEFRLQFAERIPGAMKMGADALGVTTAKFKQLLESGQVVATDFIPKLTDQLLKFGRGWEASSDTIQTNVARISNSMKLLVENRYFQQFVNSTLKGVDSMVQGLDNGTRAWGDLATALSMKNAGLLPEKQSFAEAQESVKTFLAMGDGDKLTKINELISSYKTSIQQLKQESSTEFLGTAATPGLDEQVKLLEKIKNLEAMKPQYERSVYLDTLRRQIEEAQQLADKGINPEVNGQRVEWLAKLLASLTNSDWTVYVNTRVDMTQLNTAMSVVNKLAGKSAQVQYDTAKTELERLNDPAVIAQAKQNIEILKAALSSENTDADKVNADLSKYQDFLKQLPAAVQEANKNLKTAAKELQKTALEEVNPFAGTSPGDFNSLDLKKESRGAAYQKDLIDKNYWIDIYSPDDTTRKLAQDKQRASYQAYLDGVEKDIEAANRKAAAGARQAQAAALRQNGADTLVATLRDEAGALLEALNGDEIGRQLEQVQKKFDQTMGRINASAIKGLDMDAAKWWAEYVRGLQQAKVTDDFLERLFPWLKADNTLVSAKAALDENSKSFEKLKERAESAGLSIEYVRSTFADKEPLVEYQKALAKLKMEMEIAPDLTAFSGAFSKLRSLEYGPNGSEERKSQEDLLNLYYESTGKMYRLKADMYDRIAEKARAAGLDEQKVQAILTEKTEEAAKTMLEAQVKYSASFGETMSAKWSLAFGGYKSASTKARESWDQMADAVVNTTNGMVDGIAGGFGDLIRNIGNGTASIEDLWKNMLSRMLDAFASFVEELVKTQLKNAVGGLFSSSTVDKPISAATQAGENSDWKSIGKSIGSSIVGSFAEDSTGAKAVSKTIGKAVGEATTEAVSIGSVGGGITKAATSAGQAATAATSVLSTVGSVLGVVGLVGGVVGLATTLFDSKKEEIKKTAQGYNVVYAGGRTVASGVDFYSDGSVVSTGVTDPAITKKISDSFRTAAENLSDFAEELGFAVDVLEGFQMPNMNITSDQLDTYIASGNNMMAFKGLMEAGMRGAFDAVARDGEVYSDEYERLATSLSSVQGKFEAYGYKLSDVAQITDEQISALSAKNIEVAQGTSQAMLSMASSMGATSDQLALIASNGNDGAAALAVTNEQLSTILEADYASQLLDAVGGEDAFAAIMGNLQKNVFATVESYAKNLDYYNERAQTAISKIGDATVTVDNFWVKFDEAIKQGLTVDEFEAWGKASSWVNNIDSVHQAMTDWDQSMTKVAQSLDQRMTAAQGWDYQSKLAKQMADAEWELAAAREAGYDAALVARLQEVQAAELAATIAQHQMDYQKAMLDAQERIASAADDKEAQLALQQTRNEMELQELAKTFNWSPGSAEEPLFQAIQQAQAMELINTIRAMQDAVEQATESLTRDMSVREARLSGDSDLAEAVSMLAGQQDELAKAMEDGVSEDVIARLVTLQSAEYEQYLASIDSTIKTVETSLSTIMETLVSDMASIIDKSIEAYTTLSTDASSLASKYYNAADSMYTQLRNWAIDDSGGNPELTFKQNRALFDATYKKAMTGDATALESLSSFGVSLRNAAQGYYGSKDDYMSFYRDLQSKMGNAALVSDTLGDQKTDMAKLYDVQINLYELLKTELSKDDPNTALLETIGVTMGRVQMGIDTGAGYQRTVRDITQNSTAGSGGFQVIRDAVYGSSASTQSLMAQVAKSQSELADLLASYMEADRAQTLLRKRDLAAAQLENSKTTEANIFKSSELAAILSPLTTVYLNKNFSNYDPETAIVNTILNPYMNDKPWEGTWLDQIKAGRLTSRDMADWYLAPQNGYGAYTGTVNWQEMYEYMKLYFAQGSAGWRGWTSINDLVGYVLPGNLTTQIMETVRLQQEYNYADQQYQAWINAHPQASTSAVSSFGVADAVTTEDSLASLVTLVKELRDEVKNLRAESESANVELVVAAKKTASTLVKFDIDGLPKERTL